MAYTLTPIDPFDFRSIFGWPCEKSGCEAQATQRLDPEDDESGRSYFVCDEHADWIVKQGEALAKQDQLTK